MKFSKYQGAGNDFILIDDRALFFPVQEQEVIAKLCHRKEGIGADGLILWQNSTKADLRMRIFNADGKEAEMCGNGLRCLILFAQRHGMDQKYFQVETQHAVLACSFIDNRVESLLTPCKWDKEPFSIGKMKVYLAHTGVPHAVVFVEELEDVEFLRKAQEIRYHPLFQPAGVNVNFVKVGKENVLFLRTYERGVEGETGSCGTGVAASALVASSVYELGKKLRVIPRSQAEFEVELKKEGVQMQAPAELVFEGRYIQVPVES